MKPHHLTARLWFAGAIAATLLPAEFRLGWWLPLHMVLLGGASQLIAGGQLKFSTALAMAPEPARIHPVASLFLLNAGALSIGAGRVFAVNRLTGAGAALFLTGALWSVAVAAGRWQKGLGTRFRVTRSYYLLAGASILAGGLVGAALALGFMNDSYASHRLVHMAFNLFGWAGMTIAGTAVTLLPAMLRTRAPSGRLLRPAPHLMFAGLLVLAGGLSLGSPAWAAAGGTVLLASLVPFGLAVRRVLTTRRRFPVPVSAAHLIAAIAWLGLVSAAQLWPLAAGDAAATRDLWVVGLAGGTVVQAILGAWAFLLPMERPVSGSIRRLDLIAFELGARTQVAVYNAALVTLLLSMRVDAFGGARAPAMAVLLSATGWAVFKAFTFPALARLQRTKRRSVAWWEPLR